MAGEARDELKRRLGEDVRALDILSEQELGELLAALDDARRRQAKALAAASDEALTQMPALVRGSVRKMLGS